jgi:protein SCO1/2
MTRQVFAVAALFALASPLRADDAPPPVEDGRPAPLREIGFDQRLGATLPLDTPLRDEAGRTVALRDFFRGRPVVLSLVYYDCPMLCTLSLNGLVSALGVLKMEPGRDFELVTVSFDARETPEQAQRRKKAYLERYKRSGAEAGWHFLTGDRESIERLTRAVGFRYVWDAETSQFAHAAGIVVITPDGVISRYLYGIEYAPKDLRFALVESGKGRLGTVVDQFLLACYRYDPAHGRYGAYAMGMVRLGAIGTLLTVGGFIAVMLRRERR